MSKQEEIKQALAAATPSQESMHNLNPYFTNKQLEELSEYFKTIPVDDEGRPYEPEYNSMAVRSDVLKMISDVWQARRKQYEVEFERDRLRKELEEAQQSIVEEAKQADMWHELYLRALNDQDQQQTISVLASFARTVIQRALNDEAASGGELKELALEHLLIEEDPDRFEGQYRFTEILVGQEGEGNQCK